MSEEKTVDDYLRSIGAMQYPKDEFVKLEYQGRGEHDERFKRHGAKQEVDPLEAEELLGLEDENGPLFKKV